MNLLKALFWFLVLCGGMSGCRPGEPGPEPGPKPCAAVVHTYMPDSMYKWFTKVMLQPRGEEQYQCVSSKGVNRPVYIANQFDVDYKPKCGERILHQAGYSYSGSHSYDPDPNASPASFSLFLGFYETGNYPNGGNLYEGKIDTTKVALVINDAIPNDQGNGLPYIIDLKWIVSPSGPDRLYMNYFTHAITPAAVTVYETCDTCIKWIGNYNQGGKAFTQVFRVIDAVAYRIGVGNPNTEYLVDKEYGVIEFMQRDQTTWVIKKP